MQYGIIYLLNNGEEHDMIVDECFGILSAIEYFQQNIQMDKVDRIISIKELR